MVVQYQPDDGLAGVVRVPLPEQAGELDAAVALIHIGKDVSRVQIDSRQDRHCAVANVLVVAPNSRGFSRNRGGRSGALKPMACTLGFSSTLTV